MDLVLGHMAGGSVMLCVSDTPGMVRNPKTANFSMVNSRDNHMRWKKVKSNKGGINESHVNDV